MSQAKPDDPKDIPRKEEFQKYLEKAGVIDQLTKLLVNLYENPNRPDNAMDYIKTFLGVNVCYVYIYTFNILYCNIYSEIIYIF